MFDEKHIHVQTEKAAKIQAKSEEKIAKMQAKLKKQEMVNEMKKNQIGVYKKIGPFTIKTYLILLVIVILGIMMLVDKLKGNSGDNQKTEGVKQESVNNK